MVYMVTTPNPRIKQPSVFDVGLGERTARVVEVFGVRGAASLLGVAASQPSRWRQHGQQPDPAVARRILDLDYLVSRMAQVFTPRQAEMWLRSSNPHLGGGTPAEEFRSRGVAALDTALAAVEDGAPV